jgi:hypothetical protein
MDREEFEERLRSFPREDAIFIGQRAALRIVPIWWACFPNAKIRPVSENSTVLPRLAITVVSAFREMRRSNLQVPRADIANQLNRCLRA